MKGAKTIADLEAVVRGCDRRRGNDMREIRGELIAIRTLLDAPPINVEKMIMGDISAQLAARNFEPSPATFPAAPLASAGTALERARILFRKWVW